MLFVLQWIGTLLMDNLPLEWHGMAWHGNRGFLPTPHLSIGHLVIGFYYGPNPTQNLTIAASFEHRCLFPGSLAKSFLIQVVCCELSILWERPSEAIQARDPLKVKRPMLARDLHQRDLLSALNAARSTPPVTIPLAWLIFVPFSIIKTAYWWTVL